LKELGTFMREAVANKSKLALLYILLYREMPII
jgi:hypothetical protein